MYYDVIKQGITGGISVKLSTPTIYPPALEFLNIDGISEVGAFLTGSVEFDLSGNRYELTNGETKKVDNSISKFTVEAKFSGCIEVGLKAQLLVAQDQVEFSASGSGKACLSVQTAFNFSKMELESRTVQIEPVMLAIKLKVKSKGVIKFSLIDYEGSLAITNKIPLYP